MFQWNVCMISFRQPCLMKPSADDNTGRVKYTHKIAWNYVGMETRDIKQVPSNGLGMGSTKGIWVPTAAIICFSTTSSRHAMTSNQPPMQRVLPLPSGIKLSDCEANHSLPQHDRHESTSTSPIWYRYTIMIPCMP